MSWGSIKEIETRRRIHIAVWAYAYEIVDDLIVTDDVFDAESYKVDLKVNTTRPHMDHWFRENFEPCTGMWIFKHPCLDGIKEIYERHYK